MNTPTFVRIVRIAEALEEVKQADLGLLDCYAPWCQPCKAFATVMRKVAEEYTWKPIVGVCAGRGADEQSRNAVLFAKLDVDRYEDLARPLRIRSLPTLLVWKKGELVHRSPGALGVKELRALIERFRT